MSENTFSDCETPQAVLRSFRQLEDVDADDHDDALARIAELTPRTVTAEARERAVANVGDLFHRARVDLCRLPRPREIVDTVIDALGWTSAEAERDFQGWPTPAINPDDGSPTDESYYDAPTPAPATPAAEPERDCENCGGRKCMSCCAREMHDDCADDCPMCCPAPVPPAPAVELTAPELESLAGIVRAHERTPLDVGPLHFSLRSVPMVVEDMPERDGAKLDGISVLRIGGDQ